MKIHRFIRLLRLCSSSFQSFIDYPHHTTVYSEIDKEFSSWFLQESFNTICAATIVVVEECAAITSSFPREQEKMLSGLLDLLLHILTTPQSSVTHLRAVGAALQALEQFGVVIFFEIAGSNLQHWIRVVLSLMNSLSLSVRSISVDFVVSLLAMTFDMTGSIHDLSLVFCTVLPEVAAREIALVSVGGHLKTAEDVAKCIWPLRRSLADLEESNPLDDDRVDLQLPPILSSLVRACQAILDGVLIELRLKNNPIVGTPIAQQEPNQIVFDADEESLYEIASFFLPETAPLQRVRWLTTLQALHESKGQWVEAAETLFLCARTIADSLLHLRSVWRPSHFVLWSDARRSLWLETVGEDVGQPDRGNAQVMDFASEFLEPTKGFTGEQPRTATTGQLLQPTLPVMCRKLIDFTKQGVELYLRDDGMEEQAYAQLESLQRSLATTLDNSHNARMSRRSGSSARKQYMGEEAELRRVLASISGDMTKLAERLLLIVQNEPPKPEPTATVRRMEQVARLPHFVLLRFSGYRPIRFQESTTLPTFVEWDTPCICRVSHQNNSGEVEEEDSRKLCFDLAQPFVSAMQQHETKPVIVRYNDSKSSSQHQEVEDDSGTIVVNIEPVEPTSLSLQRFLWKRAEGSIVEMTVAQSFPCALSRQRIVLETVIRSAEVGRVSFEA